jgi:hypothetical protein
MVSRRRKHQAVVVLFVALVAGAVVSIRTVVMSGGQSAGPPCRATAGSGSYALDLEQATNATTVAAIGKRLGLPDHAVTVALATAIQESGLHNLSHGDLDSLGLFQQRPSQGWGTPNQIMTPSYAARAFYTHLAQVPGWQTMAVTVAAQSVQHSAAPSAYAQWETKARVLAQVLTGEVPAGLACHFSKPAGAPLAADMAQAMTDELGTPTIGETVSTARGWTVASWLVGHAQQYRVPSVVFDGQRWTPARAVWKPNSPAASSVQVT